MEFEIELVISYHFIKNIKILKVIEITVPKRLFEFWFVSFVCSQNNGQQPESCYKKHCQKIDHKNKFALTNTGDSSLVEAEPEAVFDQV